jgi:hypothetical protein
MENPVTRNEMLLITTTSRVVANCLSRWELPTDANHVVFSRTDAWPLSSMEQKQALIVLCTENKHPGPIERSILKTHMTNRIVHWVWHTEEDAWASILPAKDHFKRREHSGEGPIADFLEYWMRNREPTARIIQLKEILDYGRWWALEARKRQYLNEYGTQDLVRLGHRLSNGKELDLCERHLLAQYPELPYQLTDFENFPHPEQQDYHRIKLSEYFFANRKS